MTSPVTARRCTGDVSASPSFPNLIRTLAAVNAAAAFALGAERLNWPSAEVWTGHAGWLLAAVGVTAVVPFIQLGCAEHGERSRRQAMERQRDIETCLTSSLVYAVKHAGASWLDIGIQAFQVRGYWKPRHVRVAKARLRPVASSGIEWGRHKGVVGRCWASRAPQFHDLQAHFAPFVSADRATWDALPAATRFGLTYDDFQRLKGKYGIVAAVPIVDSTDRYVGCITADTSPTAGPPNPLARNAILDSLAQTADVVAVLLTR